ncbi:MAG: hypothetical protein MZV65_19615 [Chromatiales bacterium]|nr:hypothetical protein [Chromatiales bacterium]
MVDYTGDLRDRLATCHSKALARYIVNIPESPNIAFIRLDAGRCLATSNPLSLIARADDTTFGILHSSRSHERLVAGGWPRWHRQTVTIRRYTPNHSLRDLPLPRRPDARRHQARHQKPSTAAPSFRLSPPRSPTTPAPSPRPRTGSTPCATTWLNPPEWIERLPEVVPGYPDRIIAKPEHEADLKKRTLTNLYNQRPAWLDQRPPHPRCRRRPRLRLEGLHARPVPTTRLLAAPADAQPATRALIVHHRTPKRRQPHGRGPDPETDHDHHHLRHPEVRPHPQRLRHPRVTGRGHHRGRARSAPRHRAGYPP